MVKKILGEEIFQSLNGNFSVSPSNEAYTLQYSADGISFTPWKEQTPNGENLIVTGIPLIPIFWRLKGNKSDVTVQL